MLLSYSFNIDIDKNKEILYFFYPKIKTSQTVIISNKDSVIINFCKSNKNITNLIEKLDLVEV